MELKATLNFDKIVNDRVYRISIPVGAPYGEVYDAIYCCLAGIVEHQKKSVEQLKANPPVPTDPAC